MDILKIVEVLLFASSEPLNDKRFNYVMKGVKSSKLKKYIDELNKYYKKNKKGFSVCQIAGGYKILTCPEYHIYIERLFQRKRRNTLTKASMEALSIIAYKQPVSKVEIESIRGVECGSVINTLMEKKMITIRGRSKGAGRALLFVTTQHFLEIFGLKKKADLPKLDELSDLAGEIKVPTLFEIDNETK